jgi:hypothetical protein
MPKIYCALTIISLLILGCGSPHEPEDLSIDDGGYKILSKLATSGYSQDIIAVDTLLYIAQGEGGLAIVNISNPNKPVIISEVTSELRGYSYKLTMKDSVVYIAAGNLGVSVVDVSDPYNPFVTVNNLPMKPARNLYVLGDYLFTAVSEQGFNISEISFPTQPDVRSTTYTPGYAQSIVATTDSNYLLVACGEMGFAMMDISNFQLGFGTYPVVGWKDTPGYAVDILNHPILPVAFLACGTAGVKIINYADTNDVKIIGSCNTGGYAKEIFFMDNKLFVTTETRGLQVFDVTNLASPIKIGTVTSEYAMGVYGDDKYIYIADEVEGLIIIARP